MAAGLRGGDIGVDRPAVVPEVASCSSFTSSGVLGSFQDRASRRGRTGQGRQALLDPAKSRLDRLVAVLRRRAASSISRAASATNEKSCRYSDCQVSKR